MTTREAVFVERTEERVPEDEATDEAWHRDE